MTSSIDSPHSLEFGLFPNPTKDKIEVKSEHNIDYIEIYNIAGKSIMMTSGSVINLEEYDNGLYFIKIYTNKANYTEKIIKN